MSNRPGNIPHHIPPHSCAYTHVSVAEYNYLGEVVVFSERWWRMDLQRAIADPRQLQTAQVTPPLITQHIFSFSMLFAEMQLPVGSCIFSVSVRGGFCSVTRCAQVAAKACHCPPSPPHAVGTGCCNCRGASKRRWSQFLPGHLHEAEAAT